MKYLNTITRFLKRDGIQRYTYGIGLLIWILVWFRDLKYSFQNFDKITLSGQEEYWIIVSIPFILFILQIIFNNKKIWALIFILVVLASIWSLWITIVFNILIDVNKDYGPKNFWTSKKIINITLAPLIIFLINWIVWKIKPIKRTLNNPLRSEK